MATKPEIVFCISGKRKSGKDHLAGLLHTRLDDSIILHLAAPIKVHWARENGLDLRLLMGDGPYKEIYRKDMVSWGNKKRAEDPACFCEAAIKMTEAFSKSVWIVADAREASDIAYFKSRFPDRVVAVRVCADVEVRQQRGFQFTPGIDDAVTECGLDDYKLWDFVIQNNGESLDDVVKMLLDTSEKIRSV